MREGLGRSPHLVRVPARAVKRLMATFGKEADWERISGNFVIDAAKLTRIGWAPQRPTQRRHRQDDARRATAPAAAQPAEPVSSER